MALNVGRWVRYAQTRLSKTTEDANAELDRLEAEREAELAEKPWLGADGEAPTLAEARARIEWEAQHQRDLAAKDAPAKQEPAKQEPAKDAPTEQQPATPAPPTAEEAELAAARIELDRRAAESKERLAAIREELGIDPPKPDPPKPEPPADGAA